MNFYKSSDSVDTFEHLFEEDNQTVTHIVLKKDQVLPKHFVPQTAIVVPIKGEVAFSSNTETKTIFPGMIVQMMPGEKHSLKGMTDCELMVIKSHLA